MNASHVFKPLHYHGRIPSSKRDGIIKTFKEEKDRHVILMSYGAGAVGLNLQFCHYVFLFDRWWNPAVEDQAINRAHRLGVTGTVTVTRMTSLETIGTANSRCAGRETSPFQYPFRRDGGSSHILA